MSKKVKNLIQREIAGRFEGVESIAVINPRGINANKNNAIRRKLREQGVRMTVVRNTLAKRAVGGEMLKGFEALLDGPSAVIYGDAGISAIARILMEEKKTNEAMEMRGIFFDGEVYLGEEGVKQVSKLPTREEAIANLMAVILGPGRKLAGALKGPGGKIAGVLKTIEEKAPAEAVVDAAPEAGAAPEGGAAAEGGVAAEGGAAPEGGAVAEGGAAPDAGAAPTA